MASVSTVVQGIQIGKMQSHENLSLFPLLTQEAIEPDYRLLDAALEAGCARVTEVDEAGSVPELAFVNECDWPVLLLDGEELIGAKQNRILNLSVLAPAHQTIVIPVSCVEAGRWRAESTEFASANRAHFAAGRARKSAQVSASLRTDGSRRSDQGEVWNDISERAARMDARSATGAAAALYETHRPRLEAYRSAFTPVDHQTGALFAINGKVVGFDLFDSPQTLASLMPKLVRSYALDAIDASGQAATPAKEAAAKAVLVEAAQAAVERFPAIGEGEDLRLHGEGLAGGALAAKDRLIHLCVFRLESGNGATARGHRPTRLASASRRRRSRH